MMNVGMRRFIGLLTLACLGALCSTLLVGCDSQQDGLYLPAGDTGRGLDAFQALACPSCHAVAEHTIERTHPHPSIYVILGGPSTRVKSYPDLVTAIVNPNHKLSRGADPRTVTPEGSSRMHKYNELMTVQQLIDIVEFLKPTYYVWTPEATSYQFPEQ